MQLEKIYAKTENMAFLLDVSVSFLNENKGTVFKIGTHYYIPSGKKYCLWNIKAMQQWVEHGVTCSEADEILKSICA